MKPLATTGTKTAQWMKWKDKKEEDEKEADEKEDEKEKDEKEDVSLFWRIFSAGTWKADMTVVF